MSHRLADSFSQLSPTKSCTQTPSNGTSAEAANNASAAGVLVPMLALGLPTSATAAIMLSAFQSYGISQSAWDLGLLYAGDLMRRFDFPTAPVIIGLILGPLAEQECAAP